MQISPDKLNAIRVASAARVSSRPTLLFVDDEERILRSLKMLFAPNYNVRVTTDGREALKILEQEKVHALISDQRMPLMMGVEVLRQAREVSPNTMRLLLTGYSDLDAIMGSINEGEVFRFINKPWDAEHIKATVASAVEIAASLDNLAIPAATEAAPSREKILVIDENPQTVEDIQGIISDNLSEDISVIWANDLETVLDVLSRHEIALVITESRLGDTDITTLIKHLKRYNPRTVSVLLTAFHDASMLVGLINQAQVFRCIPKPIRRNLMLSAIKAALASYRAYQLAPALVKKHAVEAAPEMANHPLARRMMGLFRTLAGQRA